MLPKNRPPSQSSMCGFLFIAVLNGTDKANSLGVFCSKSHLSNQRVLLTPHPLLSILYPPKKEVTWVFSAASHLQAIREAININALPQKKVTWVKADPSHIQAIQEETDITSPSKSSNLAVLRSKSPPSNSRGNRHQFPPKKEEAWVFSAASHLQVIREIKNVNSLPKKR